MHASRHVDTPATRAEVVRATPARRAAAFALALALTVLALAGTQVSTAPRAQAAVASGFNAGNIISDPVFHDSGSMDADAVEAFLTARVTSCSPGSTCLAGYTETTWTRTDSTGACSTYTGAANESAAQIIVKVGQACGINPKVLLVLVQKEQGLVTATAPTASKFQRATGFGCPDTAPCNTQYYGFFNQVYLAARQFDFYVANPTKYGYQAGRSNFIGFNPNSSCGGSQVYIANTSTAALYNYTPYQPDTAAMTNLYGTGDSCSAYGNRNFWRYFTDWFGSPQSGGFFVHAPGDPAVYLVTDTAKLPVASMSLVSAFAPLGSVGTVSASYLATLPTGTPLGRVVTVSDGSTYFVDRGAKHYMASCDLVADFGSTCGALPALSDVQVSDLSSGDPLSATFKSTNSSVVWVADDGTRHEVLDWTSLTAAGDSQSISVLDPAVAASLTISTPVARPDVVVTARDSGQAFLLSPAGASLVPPGFAKVAPYPGLVAGSLDPKSIQALGFTGAQDGAVTDGTSTWLLTADGHLVAATSGALAGLVPRPWSSTLLGEVPVVGPSGSGSAVLVHGASSGTVYRAADGSARPVLSWPDLQALARTANPFLVALPDASVAAMAKGASVLAPGAVVKTASSGDVFVLDGTSTKLHLPSFDVAGALGLARLRTVPNGTLDGYAAGGDLSSVVACSGTASAGVRGALRALPSGTGLPATTLADATCATLRTGAALTSPVAVQERGSGVVWVVSGGGKRQAASWAALVRAMGTASPTLVGVPTGTLSGLPAGAPLT